MKLNNNNKENTILNFKVQKMFILPDCGSLKGFADVIVNDLMVIRGVRIIEGIKGVFATMPAEQGKDGKFYDQVTLLTKEAFDSFSLVVLNHYNENKHN